MSPRPLRVVSLPLRAAGLIGLGSALLLVPATSPAQNERDRIDITGRQNLTLGSGARAYGMGGAFLARADDATAASWNPAGLSYLRVPEVSLVGVSNRFTQTKPLLNDHFEGRAFDFAAFSWPVVLGPSSGAVQVSYQRAISFDGDRRVTDFVLSTEADLTLTPGTVVEDRRDQILSSGGFDIMALGMGLNVTRSLRAGLTVNRWFNGYDQTLTRRILYRERRNPLRELQLDFRPRGWSYNLGLIWSPVEPLNLAAVYKTSLSAEATLDKSRRDTWMREGVAIQEVEEVTENDGTSDDVRLVLPASFGLGVSWRPRDRLTLSADFTRTQWSRARIAYHFDLERTGPSDEGIAAPKPPPVILGPSQYPTLVPLPTSADPDDPARINGQQDSEQLRLGVEWVLIRGALRIPLRAGYFNDRQIERSPTGDLLRFGGVTAGLGIVLGPVLLDVAYMYESSEYFVTPSREQIEAYGPGRRPSNRYASTTNRLFASLIYRFSRRN